MSERESLAQQLPLRCGTLSECSIVRIYRTATCQQSNQNHISSRPHCTHPIRFYTDTPPVSNQHSLQIRIAQPLLHSHRRHILRRRHLYWQESPQLADWFPKFIRQRVVDVMKV